MEGLLKLIVGIDGVTAATVTQVAWLYFALKVAGILGFLSGIGIIASAMLKAQRVCIAHELEKKRK